MKRRFAVPYSLLRTVTARTRSGETQAEMVTRFGPPGHRAPHSVVLQGKRWELRPLPFFARKDRRTAADLLAGRCVRVRCAKRCDWTEDQMQIVLAYNAQVTAWPETSQANFVTMVRTWKRSDGGDATRWREGGFELRRPALGRAKTLADAKAKAGAGGKPKI